MRKGILGTESKLIDFEPSLVNVEPDVEKELSEERRRDSVVDGEHSLRSDYTERPPHHSLSFLLTCGLHRRINI